MGYFLYRESFFQTRKTEAAQELGAIGIRRNTGLWLPKYWFFWDFCWNSAICFPEHVCVFTSSPLFKAEALLQGSTCAIELLSPSESCLSIMSISMLCVLSSVCPKKCNPLWGNVIYINAIPCSGSRLSACLPFSFDLSLSVLGPNDFHNSTQVHVTTIKWSR